MQTIKRISSLAKSELRQYGVRVLRRPQETKDLDTELDVSVQVQQYPRKIFSGIQPTGTVHLGNYLGAIKKWTKLQNSHNDVTYCIVDMHAITLPQDPGKLRENIFEMAATLMACGINPDKAVLFVQSSVKEHAELSWILNCLTTMARLGHMPQYKEKTRNIKDIPLGLFVYPVLQAADIMLYKSTHVPVGEDQVQHIQLTQHLTKTFNNKFGETFPYCQAIVDNRCARIRSLRDPTKKMSKSDPDPKSVINLLDEPDVIVEKVKKALTDFTSDVSYNPNMRPGVSNLLAIHSLCADKTIEAIVEESRTVDTGMYKMQVAEAVVEHLKPLRTKINSHLNRRSELIYLLDMGADKARTIAQKTIQEVREKTGLGAMLHMPIPPVTVAKEEPKALSPIAEVKIEKSVQPEVPVGPVLNVPKQSMRVEKKMKVQIPIRDFSYTSGKDNADKGRLSLNLSSLTQSESSIVPELMHVERKATKDPDDTSSTTIAALVPCTNPEKN